MCACMCLRALTRQTALLGRLLAARLCVVLLRKLERQVHERFVGFRRLRALQTLHLKRAVPELYSIEMHQSCEDFHLHTFQFSFAVETTLS